MNKNELGTVIFALENYARDLELETNFKGRNMVYDLITKLEREAN